MSFLVTLFLPLPGPLLSYSNVHVSGLSRTFPQDPRAPRPTPRPGPASASFCINIHTRQIQLRRDVIFLSPTPTFGKEGIKDPVSFENDPEVFLASGSGD